MKHHVIWSIFSVITFAGHMVAALYSDFIYFLAEYIRFVSLACSVVAIYTGAKSAGITHDERRGMAIASASIGAIILLGLLISASSWLFIPGNGPEIIARLKSVCA